MVYFHPQCWPTSAGSPSTDLVVLVRRSATPIDLRRLHRHPSLFVGVGGDHFGAAERYASLARLTTFAHRRPVRKLENLFLIHTCGRSYFQHLVCYPKLRDIRVGTKGLPRHLVRSPDVPRDRSLDIPPFSSCCFLFPPPLSLPSSIFLFILTHDPDSFQTAAAGCCYWATGLLAPAAGHFFFLQSGARGFWSSGGGAT